MSEARAILGRAALYRRLRGFFEARGFVEVETPLRVRSPGLEVHLEAVGAGADGGEARWLITSPEYHCKRALALEELPRIFELCKCFRAGEYGPWHHVEFTMLEWYRRDSDYLQILQDTEDLLVACLGETTSYQGAPVELRGGCERLSTQQAMVRHAGIDWRAHPERDDFARIAAEKGYGPIPADDTWDDIFHRIFLTSVERKLGFGRPTALLDYPASQSALARLCPHDPAVAERFEVYVAGLELCNAFSELVDAGEQRRRFLAEQEERRALGRTVHPIDEHLLAALGRLPPSGGIALGVDRLLMLALDAPTLREVLPFGYERL